MKSLGEVLTLSADFLQKRGVERPRRQVEELLSSILKLPRIELYMQYDRPLIEAELNAMREAVKRRAEGEPWQYIAGAVEFLGCRINVNRSVLIPRQETEILADLILKELPPNAEIWDVCAGSGCIGIALRKKRPDCKVVLSDISPEALKVAHENAQRNAVDVEFLQGDLLAPFQGRKADIIVCNPPYIFEKDYGQLEREVRDWEPKLALVGGLECYRRMAEQLPQHLKPNTKVYFELGTGMGEQVKNLFHAPQSQVLQDWASHDRFLKMTFTSHACN